MEFLSLTGREFGVLGSAGVLISTTIYYVLKFQRTFTERLEKQSQLDQEKIRTLETTLAERTIQLQAEQYRNAMLTRAMILRGIDPENPLSGT